MGLGFSSVFRLGAQNSHFSCSGLPLCERLIHLKNHSGSASLLCFSPHTVNENFKILDNAVAFLLLSLLVFNFLKLFTLLLVFTPSSNLHEAELNIKLQGVRYHLHAVPYSRDKDLGQ